MHSRTQKKAEPELGTPWPAGRAAARVPFQQAFKPDSSAKASRVAQGVVKGPSLADCGCAG